MKPGSHTGYWPIFALESINIAHFRAVFIHRPSGSKAQEELKAESGMILFLLEVGPCQQKVHLNSQQLKQRWAIGIGMGLQSVYDIKQTCEGQM